MINKQMPKIFKSKLKSGYIIYFKAIILPVFLAILTALAACQAPESSGKNPSAASVASFSNASGSTANSTANSGSGDASSELSGSDSSASVTQEKTGPAQTQLSAKQQADEKQAGEAKAEKAEELYEQGYQLYMEGSYDLALQYFDNAIKEYSDCYKAYNGKGIVLCFKGNFSEGMALINKALEICPDFPYSNFNMALAYKLKKDYASSLEWFDKTIALDPYNTWSYFGKACIYAEWGDADKALPELVKAIETDPGVKDIARHEPDLDPIRNDPRFAEMIK